MRAGPPVDDKPDMELPVWAGVLPFNGVAGVGQPQPDPQLAPGLEVPGYVTDYRRPVSGTAA